MGLVVVPSPPLTLRDLDELVALMWVPKVRAGKVLIPEASDRKVFLYYWKGVGFRGSELPAHQISVRKASRPVSGGTWAVVVALPSRFLQTVPQCPSALPRLRHVRYCSRFAKREVKQWSPSSVAIKRVLLSFVIYFRKWNFFHYLIQLDI